MPGEVSRRPQSVLFMCGQNSVRSPMAEVLARHYFGRSIYFASAGVKIGEADPFVPAVLDEVGLSLGRHRSQLLEDLEDLGFDLVVTLSPEAHHAALELTRTLAIEVEYWPTADPTGLEGSREQRMAAYREVREALKQRILERLR